MGPVKRLVRILSALSLSLLLLISAAAPAASAAGTGKSYVLTKVVEAAADGYSYADMEEALRQSYEQSITDGMTFDYEWAISDEQAYFYHEHQYDGKLYPPHDRITESVKIIYTKPSSFGSREALEIPFTIGWTGKNKTPTAGSALATFHVIVFAGDDSYTQEKPGGLYYLDADDELRGTYTYTPDYDYKYIYVYTLSGIGAGAKLGRGYVYELRSDIVTAGVTKSNVLVNGSKTAFDAYNIGGNNFFKLRDLAMALQGSSKQFSVDWDNMKNAISITTNKAYVPVGGELSASGTSGNKQGTLSTSRIYIDGKETSLLAYNIGGSNYFKLRDLMLKLDIGLTYDEASGTISIDTSSGYSQ